MNYKPAALVFSDSAGNFFGPPPMELAAALDKFKRITHGLDLPPIGAVTAEVISRRGSEKKTKLIPIEPTEEKPITKPRKG